MAGSRTHSTTNSPALTARRRPRDRALRRAEGRTEGRATLTAMATVASLVSGPGTETRDPMVRSLLVVPLPQFVEKTGTIDYHPADSAHRHEAAIVVDGDLEAEPGPF